MSLSKPETPFQITPDLLHDARINYKPWLACIFSIAASQCQTQFDSGCLFMVMTDAEYAAFPLHVDASGNTIQRPTVVPPKLPPLDAPAGTVTAADLSAMKAALLDAFLSFACLSLLLVANL